MTAEAARQDGGAGGCPQRAAPPCCRGRRAGGWRRLKKLVAESGLEIEVMKEINAKKW